jgi:hypothetical protein
MSFGNGWAVSVQFGPGNYADDVNGSRITFYGVEPLAAPRGMWRAGNAEIAVFEPSGEFLRLDYDDVAGYIGPETVAHLLSTVAALDYDLDVEAARVAVCATLGLTPGESPWDDDDDEPESEPESEPTIGSERPS